MMSPAAMYSRALFDHCLVGFGGHVGPEGEGTSRLRGGLARRPRRLQEGRHLVDPADGPIVNFLQIPSLVRHGTGDDLDRVADVVEDNERIGDQEDGLVLNRGLSFSGGELFEIADHLVTEKTHGPPEEPGQPLHRDGAVAVEDFPEEVQGVAPVGGGGGPSRSPR